MKHIDYVELYAEKLKSDNSFFQQQKTLVESQIKGSKELFHNMWGSGEKFKKNAREYLKKRGLI